MSAGELTEEIILMLPVQAQSASGEISTTYQDQPLVYARYLGGPGRELVAAGAKQDVTVGRFRIRRRDDVTPAWRLRWSGFEHAIVSATPLDREWMEVVAERGLP